MEQRTCNIIMCCKGNTRWSNYLDTKDCIKKYMGAECAYPWYDYTDSMLHQILKEAFIDFIGQADNPSYITRELLNAIGKKDSLVGAIISVFCLVNVRNTNNNRTFYCINGFTEKMLRESDCTLNKV